MIQIHVGTALSDANDADIPTGMRIPEMLPRYVAHFRQVTGVKKGVFELQPNDPFVELARYPDQFGLNRHNRWLRTVEFDEEMGDFLDQRTAKLGVHQPLIGDTLSSNYFTKYKALEEVRRAMDFANGIEADYFVFHLAQIDKWDWERSDQIAKSIKIFKELAIYYRSHSYKFVPCIELLQYPKFPATGGELSYLLNECQKLLSETQIALNISHLWRSRHLMLATDHWEEPNVSFIQHLEFTLAQCWRDIHLFQLGGCWESETHAVPGLHPQQNPYQDPMKLHETSGVYHESGEIDLNRTLDLLLEYTVDKGRDLNLILQIHDRDIGQVSEAARLIREDLLARVEKRLRSGFGR